MDRKIKRGELYRANLTPGVGSEQSGSRPVLIIQNDTGNSNSGTVIVAAVTSKTERMYIMPTHVRLQAQHGLARVSYILLEQLHTIDKARLTEFIGTLSSKAIRKVDKALAVSIGLR
jgi:mRNA-degrading endonuclease toxin of MazEF toxin-antitoxin module